MLREKWSTKARKEYVALLVFLNEEWSPNVAMAFIDKTELLIEALRHNPRMYKASEKRPFFRLAVITKQSTLVYGIERRALQIISIQDNRKNPKSNQY